MIKWGEIHFESLQYIKDEFENLERRNELTKVGFVKMSYSTDVKYFIFLPFKESFLLINYLHRLKFLI